MPGARLQDANHKVIKSRLTQYRELTMKNESWVLVANSAQARLFRLEKMSKLQELYDFVHPESRFHERDLIDTKPGRAFDSTTPTRHAMQPKSSQKDQECELFAKSIAT